MEILIISKAERLSCFYSTIFFPQKQNITVARYTSQVLTLITEADSYLCD